VREALQRLATNGLVVPASSGWLIAGINENDLRELFELRRLLEPVGLDKLVRADDRAIAELSGFFDEFRTSSPPNTTATSSVTGSSTTGSSRPAATAG
jgi:DNA-binding GntR family transcriptional regulator